MATLDLAGIITRVCTDLKEKFASKSALEAKQDKLVSGTNIKTINSTSLLGSGNISVATSDKVGYQLRTNDIAVPASDTCGPYRLWFTSADGTKMVPINTDRTNSSAATKTLNTRPIDPFGRIMYYDYYATADTGLTTNGQWDQYSLAIAYSYVKALTNKLPVYLKCTPQSNGSAVMADVVQALPSTNDGYIYIFLGMAYSTTKMELLTYHPVYWHDGTGIRLWTGAESGGGGMVITVTQTSSGPSLVYTLDKTVGEITSALSEGVSPLFSFTDGTGLRYYGMDNALFTSSNSRLYIKSTGWSTNFSASGLDAYPSLTQSGGGDN